ncbi:hypothetical protein NQ023_05585 [Corynebacterium phoceense]|uniref:Uncharacterized protein n=1 Tax=Corynebacterium phoceense TaxID=1686286 RepID=A0A540R659_9CORY|nr:MULTISPECIES: hypothetical protein [Corynebacterium]MBF9012000.1 hypothetical protein [Corynebacterium phoceense]MCQ9330876.1 hypothetical protein [Corynebacterium phoceense]MCQ9339702.1 hypothetical protein [Corynebacterium phoceense]MCQ9344569.1 hypothetical protein [Corynebacterium phoceense]MCQ9347940.1 hypothetical protein [Corynebacterium phoceense]
MAKTMPGTAPVPVALRVGGAFMALALVLLLFGVLSLVSDGWMVPYGVSPRFLLIVAAAALAGAFVTTSTEHRGSPAQVIGLVAALALVIASRFVSAQAIGHMAQYWLFLYAVAALLCALVIRRSLIPKD